MKSLSRQAPNSQSTSDLQAYGRNMTLTELLLKRSGDIRQSMMAGAATIGLEFICDDEQQQDVHPLEKSLWNLNDSEELWKAIFDTMQSDRVANLQQRGFQKLNEQFVLAAYKNLCDVCQQVSRLSKCLSDRQAIQNVKRVCDLVESTTAILEKYKSNSSQFNCARETLQESKPSIFISQDFSQASKNSTNATPSTEIYKEKAKDAYKDPQPAADEGECEFLRQQITRLEQILEQNNHQFGIEVEKYNDILYEQQNQLKNCEKKFLQFENRIDELENECFRMREEKARDDILIEYILKVFRNMSRKLRLFQKEGNLSPRMRERTGFERRSPSPPSRYQTMGSGLRGYPNGRNYRY